MRKVYLHGSLEKFGGPYPVAVNSPRAAVSLLCASLPGLEKAIRAGDFRVVRGDLNTGMDLGVDQLGMHLGKADLHIEPVIAGGSTTGKGVIKLVAGAALLATAIVDPFGIFAAGGALTDIAGTGLSISAANVGMFGVAMALAGIGTLLSPSPQNPRSSYLFTGIQNNVDQGGPIPLVYGRIRVGSTMISGDLYTFDVNYSQAQGTNNFGGS